MADEKDLELNQLYLVDEEEVPHAYESKFKAQSVDDKIIYKKQASDYRISVQRLLWVDGKYTDPEDSTSKDATFILLKFILTNTSTHSDININSVSAKLTFAGCSDDEPGPEVIAWSPFNTRVRQGSTLETSKVSHSGTFNATLGLSPAVFTPGIGYEHDISWESKVYDEYRSFAIEEDDKSVGVCWNLTQNKLANDGIITDFYAQVLILRASNNPYKVAFKLEATSSGAKHIFDHINPFHWLNNSTEFTMTPNPDKPICKLEGVKLKNQLDVTNLGKLVQDEYDKIMKTIVPPYPGSDTSAVDKPTAKEPAQP